MILAPGGFFRLKRPGILVLGIVLWVCPLLTHAQQLPGFIRVENLAFPGVLDTIEYRTDYSFVLDYAQVEPYRDQRFTFSSNSITEIMEILTRNTNLEFQLINYHIILNEKKIVLELPVKVTGRVVDEEKLPMPGVSVYIKGTTTGSISDLDGNYEIRIGDMEEPVLVFSYVGYETEEIPVKQQRVINLELKPGYKAIDEVVIIGYGTANKEELTSAIIQVDESNFKSGPSNNPIELIKGKVPGLSVVNQAGNDPNASPQVNLRGIGTISANNEPLVIIDGVYSNVPDLYLLNANDIESFNILKDAASTAIYGTRGSNGVIIVKTKSGKSGATNLEYSGYGYMEMPSRKPEVLDNEQYIEILRSLGFPRSETDKGYNTYWFDELIQRKPSAFHNLSFSKSYENSSMRVSVGRKDHQGIALDTYNKTTNFRFNYNQELFDRVEFNTIIGGSRSDQRFTDYNAFDEALKYDPTAPVYNEDGSFYELPGVGASNPVALISQKENKAKSDRFVGSLEGKVEIIPELTLSLKGSTFLRSYKNTFFEDIDSRNSNLSGISGTAIISDEAFMENVLESIVNYRYSFDNQYIKVMAGYSFIENMRSTTSMTNRNFLTNTFGTDNIGAGSFLEEGRASMESYREKSRLIAFFGRINYSLESRYLLNASIRREGASVFGENNKWGWFPSLSAAWRISEEEFFLNIGSIEELKIRAGYGITGRSQGIPMYQSLSRIGYSGNSYFNGQWIRSYGPLENANPNLRWERTRELNIGTDISLWKNRVGGSLDVYDRLTIDLLGDFITQTPPSIEPSIFANVGTVRNSGIEATVSGAVVQGSRFNFNLEASYSWNRNRVVSLSNDQFQADSILYADYGNVAASLYMLAENLPIGTFYGFKCEGISQGGDWVFQDMNNDDLIQEVIDFTVLGCGLPKHMYSFTTNFSYNRFYLNIYFVGAAGFKVFNAKRLWYENTTNSPSNYFTSILDYPNNQLDDRLRFSDYYLEKGDFLRVDNIAFGYRIQGKRYIKSVDAYVSATNLYTLTAYTGLDPEVGSGTGDGLTPGWDRRSFYPRTRIFQVGLNLKF